MIHNSSFLFALLTPEFLYLYANEVHAVVRYKLSECELSSDM
jgi:mannose-6-phosphate isomerase class I